jgi:hypothetical protein
VAGRSGHALWGTAIGPKRRWFAWYPVQTFDGEWLWLRPVHRQRLQTKLCLPGGIGHWWEYSRLSDAAEQSEAVQAK